MPHVTLSSQPPSYAQSKHIIADEELAMMLQVINCFLRMTLILQQLIHILVE